MGFRFRRRVKLLPGLHLNLSKGGVSLTAGVPGANVNIGRHGVSRTLGAPGTGLHHREQLASWGGAGRGDEAEGAGSGRRRPIILPDTFTMDVAEDGAVTLRGPDGSALSERQARKLRRLYRPRMLAALDQHARAVNEAVEQVEGIHERTPPPAERAGGEPPPPPPAPDPPEPLAIATDEPWWLRLLALFFASFRRDLEQRRLARIDYEVAMDRWADETEAWHADVARHERIWSVGSDGEAELDDQAREDLLADALAALDWPQETLVDLEVRGPVVHLDVDLPEIEDMPDARVEVVERRTRLRVDELSDRARRELYARHIHGVLFRLAGTIFATLPDEQRVVISGYSQRPDPATGGTRDEYLLSAAIDRAVWRGIDFMALERVDPVAALARFELRREMTKTGVFRAVEPLGVAVV